MISPNSHKTLFFGTDQEWSLELGAGVSCYLNSKVPAQDEPRNAIREALSDPIEFPSLDQAVVPGDQLVFPVEAAVPNLNTVVAEVLRWFAENGTSPDNMAVVLASDQAEIAHALQAHIAKEVAKEVSVELHDPDSENSLAYVAANADADPIYINRTVVDADVAIPISCCRPSNGLDELGVYGIYPLISDRATRGSFYRLRRLNDGPSHAKLTDWADEAARWIGLLVEVQAIPAGLDQVGQIHAGLPEPLERRCRQEMDAAWRTEIAMADLTIALLDGGPSQQNWLGFARALHAANQCTADGGAIVVCTQSRCAVGKSFSRLRGVRSGTADLSKKLEQDTSDDSIAASLVHQITEHKHIYLVSDLQPGTIEGIGLGVLSSPAELGRLIDQFEQVAVLGSAQHRNIVLV